MSRRLLNIEALCEKLTYSKSTFNRRREDLERAGFPRPVLEADEFGSTRWDEKAIDLWLDGRMEPKLLIKTSVKMASDPAALEERLKHRAQELSL